MQHPLLTRALSLVTALLLTACGNGGGSAPTPPPANADPQARFDAPAAGTAGNAVALDAGASSDADGDTLVFGWDFGDGTRGGGAQLSHVFVAPGRYTVTLTVDDGRGGHATATREIDIGAGTAAGAPAPATLQVSDGNGAVAGATVTLVGGAATAQTGPDGRATVSVPTGPAQVLKVSKSGYADQFRPLQLAPGASGTLIPVRLQPRDAPLTLADAAAGGTLAGRDGATLAVPAGALVDGTGQPVSGAVQVSITPVDVATDPRAFPGLYQGLRPAGTRGLIESYGTVEFVLTRNGAPLQVAPGRQVTIEIPIYTSLNRDGSLVTVGATIPLWSLDERTGSWVQEGQGTVVGNAASPSGLALRANVGHLSWWNCDQWLGSIPEDSYNPNVRCCIRDTANGPCKENSGDVCEHSGSGGGASSAGASLMRALGFQRSPSAATPRVPAVAAFATAPAVAGARLPMPANLDITLESTARNGTYRGVTVVRGGAGVVEDITVSVLPVAGGGDGEPITLPWQQDYALQSAAEVDRFTLVMPAGPGFELYVSRSGSTLSGSVRLTRPDGSTVQQNFAAGAAYLAEATVAQAGTYSIEVSGGSGTPGGYRLEAVGFGSCSSTQAATVPSTLQVELAPRQSRCYDVTLAADGVLRARRSDSTNGIAGSIALATAGGVQQLAAQPYPGAVLMSGVSAAGTYRLRVTNTTLNTGRLDLVLDKPAVEVLAVPDSRTVTDLAQGAPRLYVVKPPADGVWHAMLTATGVQAGVQVDPVPASFLAGCAGCANPSTAALALRTAAPALPVITLFRNAGTANPGTVVLRTGVPQPMARDADVTGSTGALPVVHAFDANAGDRIAWGLAQPEANAFGAGLMVTAPSGATPPGNGPVYTLAEGGLYSAVVSPLGSSTGLPYTLRVNNVPAVQPLVPTPPLTTQALNLPLGQVLRFSMPLAQGDLVGLGLTTTGLLSANASIAGVVAIGTPVGGSGPFAVNSPPAFVNTGGDAVVTLRSTSVVLERARGPVTLAVQRPVPPTVALNTVRTGTLSPQGWASVRVDVPAAGRYLLRVAASTPAPYDLVATVWAASSPVPGYAGEFSSTVSSSAVAVEGLGALAAGSYTVSVRHPGNTPVDIGYRVSLVDLEAPVALAVNGSALGGTLDTAGERDYASFNATGGQAYTLRVTPAFAGTLRVHKLNPNGDWTNRSDFLALAGTPRALAAGVETVLSFTVPDDATFGSGSYIVEIVGEADATGSYSLRLQSP